MIEKIEYYRVRCDCCGYLARGWQKEIGSLDDAEAFVKLNGWMRKGMFYYCPDCKTEQVAEQVKEEIVSPIEEVPF